MAGRSYEPHSLCGKKVEQGDTNRNFGTGNKSRAMNRFSRNQIEAFLRLIRVICVHSWFNPRFPK